MLWVFFKVLITPTNKSHVVIQPPWNSDADCLTKTVKIIISGVFGEKLLCHYIEQFQLALRAHMF